MRVLFQITIFLFSLACFGEKSSSLATSCKNLGSYNLGEPTAPLFDAHTGTSYLNWEAKVSIPAKKLINDFANMEGSGVLNVQLLSENTRDAEVYLVVTNKSKAVIKSYYNKKRLDNDVMAFKILKHLLKNNPQLPMRLTNFVRVGDRGMILNYIPGATVESLDRMSIWETKYSEYTQNYHKLAEVLEEQILKDFTILENDNRAKMHYIVEGFGHETTEIWLHGGNILVDNLRANHWVIDPN